MLRPRSRGEQDIHHRIATQGSNSGQSLLSKDNRLFCFILLKVRGGNDEKAPELLFKKTYRRYTKKSLHGGVGRAQALVLRPRSKGGTRYFLVLYIQTREFLTDFFMPIQNSKSQRGHKLKSSRTVIQKNLSPVY